MKHIFFLHSHITYYVALAVINYRRIPQNEILFAIARNYNNSSLKDKVVVDFTTEYNDVNKIFINKFFLLYKYVKIVDKKLEPHIIGQEYTVYLPLIENKIMQFLATNRKCVGMHIIEEGGTSYAPYFMHFKYSRWWEGVIKESFNKFLDLFKSRFFYVKVYDIRRFKKSETTIFYCITPKAFNKLPFPVKHLNPVQDDSLKYEINEGTALVLEGAVEQGNLSFDTFYGAIEKIVSQEQFKKLHIKFHPVQTTNNRKKIIELLKSHEIEVINIPDEIPFEQIAISSKKLKVIGFTSSLLFYSKAFGCEVESHEKLLLNDHLFKRFREKNNFNLDELL